MGFAIIQRKNDMGLWLEQDIDEKKFDQIIKNLQANDSNDHEWGNFYDDKGLFIKSVNFNRSKK